MTEEIKQKIEQINNGEVPHGYKKIMGSVVAEDFVEKTFAELFTFYGGLGKSREELGENGIPYLHYGDMHRNAFTKVSSDEYLKQPKYDMTIDGTETFLLRDGDIAFLDASEDLEGTSRCVLIDNPENKPFISGLHTLVARCKNDSITKDYKQYITLSDYVRKQFMRLSCGFKVYGINRNSIQKITFAYPKDKSEQERIAKILSAWDEAIQLQTLLIEKLEVQKTALMQRLLKPKEGWKPVALVDILIERSEKTKRNNQQIVLSSTMSGLFLQSDYFDKEVASQDNVGYKILRLGQIVISPQNLWLGNINYNDSFEIGMVSPSYKIFEIKKKYSQKFIAGVMKSPKMIYQYKQSSEQGASIVRRNLNMDLFNQIVIHMPPEKHEQEEIANIILSVETLVNTQIQKLQSLKAQQKAMMQLLLTGIVRVNKE